MGQVQGAALGEGGGARLAFVMYLALLCLQWYAALNTSWITTNSTVLLLLSSLEPVRRKPLAIFLMRLLLSYIMTCAGTILSTFFNGSVNLAAVWGITLATFLLALPLMEWPLLSDSAQS